MSLSSFSNLASPPCFALLSSNDLLSFAFVLSSSGCSLSSSFIFISSLYFASISLRWLFSLFLICFTVLASVSASVIVSLAACSLNSFSFCIFAISLNSSSSMFSISNFLRSCFCFLRRSCSFWLFSCCFLSLSFASFCLFFAASSAAFCSSFSICFNLIFHFCMWAV